VQDVEQLANLFEEWAPDAICARVADMFQVRITEVALLELRGKLLHFVFPGELRTAGAIPVSSSAVAARTAQTKKAEIFNSFTQVNHFSVFELVKLGDSGLDDQVIQKLMSAPVLSRTEDVLGVIQISRKGPRPTIAGPDFTQSDLQKLESIARFIAKFMAKARAAAQAASQI
jgi:GAF domain-containing protein